MGRSNGELQGLVDRAMAYGLEVSTVKSKIMTNSTNNISADISISSQKLEEVTNFKYLGAYLSKDGTCSAQIHISIASAMAAMVRINGILWSNAISCTSKFKLYKSLVTSIPLMAVKHGPCLTIEKRIQDFENKFMKKLPRISFSEHKTNDSGAEQDQLR